MKTITFFIAILALSLSACAQMNEQKTVETKAEFKAEPRFSKTLDTTVPWLQAKIWDYQSKPVTSPPRSVIKTTYEGKPVYYMPAVCCYISSELYAEDGALLCYPSGGFTGAGNGRCPKFKLEYLDSNDNKTKADGQSNSKSALIWEDKRKPAVGNKPERVILNLQ